MRSSLLLLGAVGIPAAALTPGVVSATTVPPGCTGRPAAVAYYAGGQPATASGAPLTCGSSTGFAEAESHIVSTASGTVIVTPAVVPSGVVGTGEGPGVLGTTQGNATPAGIAVTTDEGAHWKLVKPSGVTWNPTDHGDYIDPRSGRFLFEDYGPIPLAPEIGAEQEGPAYISWSDDLTRWHHTVISDVVLPENPRFTSGVAPSGQEHPAGGYPSVLYFCANINIGFTSPAIQGRSCYRSLDGGSSWTKRSQLLSATVPRHRECGTSGEDITAIDGYYPEATSDGDLYTLVACGGKTYLARSTDEAATFPVISAASGALTNLPIDSVITLGSGPQLRIDSADDFYVVYPTDAGNRLVLITSKDRGRTWSSPADITPPGIVSILRWAVATRGPGQLGLAIVAQQKGRTTFDGVVATTTTALAARPQLWAATTNTTPLLYADHITGAGNLVLGQGQIAVPYPFPLGVQPIAGPLVAGMDFIGVTIGPDGSVWGSFDQDCGPTARSPTCVAQDDQTRGFVGALRPRAAAAVQPSKHPATKPVAAAQPPSGGLAATGGPGALAWVAALMCGAAVVARRRAIRSEPSPRP